MVELSPAEIAKIEKATLITKKHLAHAGQLSKDIYAKNDSEAAGHTLAIAQIIATNYAATVAASK